MTKRDLEKIENDFYQTRHDLLTEIMSSVSETEEKRIELPKPVRLFDLTYESWISAVAIYEEDDIFLVEAEIHYHYSTGTEKYDQDILLNELNNAEILSIAKVITN